MLPAATNDVQKTTAVASGPGEIRVDGEFIEDTTAEGCFIVLQCEEESPDVFIALPLPDDAGTNVSITISSIPSSTYTMLVYDLEQDGLPNTAIELVCIFNDIAGDVSCVLVYREYGNTTITVRELSKNEETLSISLSDPDKYTFAVFGKSGSDIDQRPIISSRGLTSATTSPTDTTETTSTKSTVGSASKYNTVIFVHVYNHAIIITIYYHQIIQELLLEFYHCVLPLSF